MYTYHFSGSLQIQPLCCSTAIPVFDLSVCAEYFLFTACCGSYCRLLLPVVYRLASGTTIWGADIYTHETIKYLQWLGSSKVAEFKGMDHWKG